MFVLKQPFLSLVLVFFFLLVEGGPAGPELLPRNFGLIHPLFTTYS